MILKKIKSIRKEIFLGCDIFSFLGLPITKARCSFCLFSCSLNIRRELFRQENTEIYSLLLRNYIIFGIGHALGLAENRVLSKCMHSDDAI